MIRVASAIVLLLASTAGAQTRYTGADGRLRVSLAQQPFSPNGTSRGPNTMASGGIRDTLARLNLRWRYLGLEMPLACGGARQVFSLCCIQPVFPNYLKHAGRP